MTLNLTTVALTTTLAFSLTVAAYGNVAKVFKVEGDVSFDGKPVKAGEVLAKGGTLKTGANGKAKIFLNQPKAFVFAAPSSEIEIADGRAAATVTLKNGLSRWIVKKNLAANANTLTVRTRTASMGVRGTDFVATFNPLLNESEIVCFNGKVEFASLTNAKDKKMINKGQWGGIGGRFGKSIGDVLTLPKPVLDQFAGRVPADEQDR